MQEIIRLFADANTQWVLAGSMLLGLSSGVLGSFALLRKQSLIGDAMAHAALPGVCVAFMIFGTKSIGLFLIGAAISGLLAAFAIQAIVRFSRIKEDASLGLVLSVFFGVGIVLLTRIQSDANGNQSGLDSFLFGQAASLVGNDVKMMMAISLLLLFVTLLLFKEFKLLSFDPNFGRGLGFPMDIINMILMTLIVGAVVIGLQAVGVVLMAAMLITPAIAARYWTERLDRMVIIAGFIGACSGAVGTLISAMFNRLPTGPLIVVAATIIFLISLVFAPQRGLLAKGVRQLRLRRKIARENVLQSLYDLLEKEASNPDERPAGYTLHQLQERRVQSGGMVRKVLQRLEREGMVRSIPNDGTPLWQLTEKGFREAYKLTENDRMWEIMLMYEAKFAGMVNDVTIAGLGERLPESVSEEIRSLMESHGRKPNVSLEDFRQREKEGAFPRPYVPSGYGEAREEGRA